jgi:tetratricopeptide (TPR) repeat protein/predicted Ser/Thr protein kinase
VVEIAAHGYLLGCERLPVSEPDSQWPQPPNRGPPPDDDEGRDSAILRATVGARLFDAAPYRIGRFTIVRRLGAGGMGVVYLGIDPELEREVAIKVMHEGGGDGTLQSERDRGRMRAEAQMMAKLRHPNVVVVHEVGEHEGGLFVAMEYVRGTTLRGWLRNESRTLANIIEAFVAAGRGLAAAHEAGVIHRDFKPDNVLVGDDTRVLVTDFGLARAHHAVAPETLPTLDGSADDEVSRSKSGIAGTPAYMAPECLRGMPATVASDQFSFCVALYEALWGNRPLGGAELPRPPSRPRVPSNVRRAVMRGLARDPAARFATMNELLSVLGNDRGAKLRRWGAIAVLGTAASGAIVWSAQRPEPCADLDAPIRALWNDERKATLAAAFTASGRPFAEAAWAAIAERTDAWTTAWADEAAVACRATQVQRTQSSELLDRRVACLDQRRRQLAALLAVLAAPDATTIERGPQAIEKLQRPESCAEVEALSRRTAAPSDPQARATYDALVDRIALARAAYDTGAYARARTLASEAVTDAALLGHRPTEAEARLVLGDALDELGDSAASRIELGKTIAAAEAGGADDVSARAWLDLAYVEAWSAGDLDAADRALVFAAGELDSIGNPPDLHAAAKRLRAVILAQRGRFTEAEPIAREAITDLERAAAGPVRVAAARLGLGSLLYDAGRWDEALATMREAQDGFTAALGPLHPSTLSARSNTANVLNQVRRTDEALAEHLAVLQLREASLGPDHPTLGANLNAIASAYYYRKDYARAVEYQRRAVALAVRTRGPEHTETLVIRENLAAFLPEAGLAEEALELAQDVLDARRRVQSPEHPDVVGALESVGAALARLGRADEALPYYEDALALGERVLGADHALLLDVYCGLAELELATGRIERAHAHAMRGLALGEARYGTTHVKLASTLEALAAVERALGHADQAKLLTDRAAQCRATEQQVRR